MDNNNNPIDNNDQQIDGQTGGSDPIGEFIKTFKSNPSISNDQLVKQFPQLKGNNDLITRARAYALGKSSGKYDDEDLDNNFKDVLQVFQPTKTQPAKSMRPAAYALTPEKIQLAQKENEQYQKQAETEQVKNNIQQQQHTIPAIHQDDHLQDVQDDLMDQYQKLKQQKQIYADQHMNQDASHIVHPVQLSDAGNELHQMNVQQGLISQAQNHLDDVVHKSGAPVSNQEAKQKVSQWIDQTAPGSDINNMSIEQIEKLVPNTLTAKSYITRLSNDRQVQDALQNSPSMEVAAIKWAKASNPELGKVIENMSVYNPGDVPQAMMGSIMNNFLNQPYIKNEWSQQNQNNLNAYKTAQTNLVSHYPDFGSTVVASKISQELEDSGYNNGILNRIPSDLDQRVDDMVKDGKLSPQEEQLYKNKKFDVILKIKTPGLLENAAGGFKDVVVNSLIGLADMERSAVGLGPSEKDRLYDINDKQYNESGYHPNSFHRFTTGMGDMFGQVAGLALTAKTLKNAGLPSPVANGASFMLSSEQPVRNEASQLFPEDEDKRRAYTTVMMGINGLFGSIVGREKSIEGLDKLVSPEAKKTIQDEVLSTINRFTSGEISSDAAKQSITGTVKNILDKLPEYGKTTLKHNLSQSAQLAGLTAVNEAADVAFGAKDYDPDDSVNRVLETAKMAFLAGAPLSMLAAHSDITNASKIGAGSVYEMASDPLRYKALIQNLAATDGEFSKTANEKLKNLDLAVQLKGDMDNNPMVEGMKPEDKQKYLFQSLSQKILEEKLKNTTDAVLKDRIKLQIKQSKAFNERLLDDKVIALPSQHSVDEGEKPYFEDENNIPDLATKIVRGQPLTDEDLQLHANYPDKVETEIHNHVTGTKTDVVEAPVATAESKPSPKLESTEPIIEPDHSKYSEDNIEHLLNQEIPEELKKQKVNLTTTDAIKNKISNDSYPAGRVMDKIRENYETIDAANTKLQSESVPDVIKFLQRSGFKPSSIDEIEAITEKYLKQGLDKKLALGKAFHEINEESLDHINNSFKQLGIPHIDTGEQRPVYTSKNGKYLVHSENGKRVVRDVQGQPVSNRISNRVLNEHSENYNYNRGEHADISKAPQLSNEHEASQWLAENSSNPSEIADIFLKEEKHPTKLSAKEQAIADYGIGRVKESSYREFGDPNNITFGKAKAYLSKDGMPIDTIAKSIADHSGLNIEPQDIVDFIDRFPNGSYQAFKSTETPVHHAAREHFEELTGIPLNDKTAKIAALQHYSPSEIAKATETTESHPLPENDLLKWMREESTFLEENHNFNNQSDEQLTSTNREQPSTEAGIHENTISSEKSTTSGNQAESHSEPVTETTGPDNSGSSESQRSNPEISSKEIDKPLKDKATAVANFLRDFASKVEGDKTSLKSDLLALPKAVLSTALKAAADLIEAGGTLADAIAHVAKEAKDYLNRAGKQVNEISLQQEVTDLFRKIGILQDEKRESGIKKAVVSEEREKLGITKENFNRFSDDQIKEIGKEKVESGEIDPKAISRSIAEGKPRPLSAEETSALIYYKTKLDNDISDIHNKLIDAIKSGDQGDELVQRERLQSLDEERKNYFIMSDKTGMEQSQSFRLRKLLLDSEFNAVAHEIKYRASNEGKIPDAVLEKFKKLESDYEKLKVDMKALEEKKSESTFKQWINEEKEKSSRTQVRQQRITDIREVREQAKNSIAEKLKEQRSRFNANPIPVEIIPDLVTLAKTYIQEGIVRAEDIIDKVYDDVKEHLPGVTRREISDAVSGYGKEPKLSKDELQSHLNDAKKQMKLLSSIEDAEAGQEPAKSGGKKTEDSPRVKELKEELKKEMKKAGLPTGMSEDQKLKAFRTRTANAIKEYEQKLTDGDFRKSSKNPLPYTDEDIKLKARLNRIKNEFEQEHLKLERSQRPNWSKMLDTLAFVKRELAISSITSGLKIVAAGMERMIQTPWENLNGQILHMILPMVSEKGLLEGGGLNLKAEGKALKTFGKTWKDFFRGRGPMIEQLKRGKSSLDEAVGEQHLSEELTSYIGRGHAMLKEAVKQAEFQRALKIQADNAVKQGLDINNPVLQKAMVDAAYFKARSAIFTNKNLATEIYRSVLAHLERNGSVKGKLAATFARLELPVVTVPVNFAIEGMKVKFGAVPALAKTLQVIFTTGVKDMSQQDADYILSCLKKQGIGLSLYALGYLGYKSVGGYNTEHKQNEDEIKPGDLIFHGTHVPRWSTHTPIFEPILAGATLHHMEDYYTRKGKEGGVPEGLFQVFKGGLKEIPFIETPKKLLEIKNLQGMENHVGELAKSEVIPPDLEKWAKSHDVDENGNPIKRKPHGFIQTIESGIPGLRQNVDEAISPKMKARHEIEQLLKDGKKYYELPQELKDKANISHSHLTEFIKDARLPEDEKEFKRQSVEVQLKRWPTLSDDEKVKYGKHLHLIGKFLDIFKEKPELRKEYGNQIDEMRKYKNIPVVSGN